MNARSRSRRLSAAYSSAKAVLLRLIGSVLQVVLTVLVARWGGAAVLGQFLVFVAVANMAVSVGSGLPNLVLRHASASAADDPRTGWLWRDTLGMALAAATVAGVAGVAGFGYVALVALGVSGLVLQRVSSSTVKAAHRPGLGVLLDTTLWPLLVTVQALLWHLAGWELTFRSLAWGYLAGLLLAALVGIVVCWRLPSSVLAAWRGTSRAPRGHYTEVAVVTVGALSRAVSTNAALTLAPLFLSDSATGRLGLALRVAGFATTILVTLASYFGPLFARARTRSELAAHRRHSQVAGLALYLPIALGAIALPVDWLRLLGTDFVEVKILVVVLATGYLVHSATGLNSQLMIMRGRSHDYSRVGLVSAVLTVLGVVAGAALGGEVGLCTGLSAAVILTNFWAYTVAGRAVRDAPVTAPAEPRPRMVTASSADDA
jgi:O-antigen/teichoic acid export membrane protein